jgi:hypothetical protein
VCLPSRTPGNITPAEWTETKLANLDRRTFYRKRSEITAILQWAGFDVAFIENDFMRFRLGFRLPFAKLISRAMGATVIEATRRWFSHSRYYVLMM